MTMDLVSPGVTLSPIDATAGNLLTRNELILLYYSAGYTTSRVQRLIANNGFFLSKRQDPLSTSATYSETRR